VAGRLPWSPFDARPIHIQGQRAKAPQSRIIVFKSLEHWSSHMTRRLVQFAVGVAFIAAAALPGVAHADNQDVIDYREHIMKTLGETAQALSMIMQGKAPAENFATHAQILAITAASAEKAFTPKVPGGEAKPDVWAKWDDFDKRLKELAANTADLAKTAQAGGKDAAGPKLQAALTCKSCHDIYREQKK
jgi:cytochrome c556